MIQLVFSDLDETLLTPDHHVPLINRQAIARAREKGVRLIPTTGRGYEMTTEILKEIGIYDKENEYVIAFNGGMIVECKDFREIRFSGLDFETVKTLYEAGKEKDVCMEIFTPSCVYIFHANDDEIKRKRKQKANFKVIEGDDLHFLKNERLAKIIFEKVDMPYLHSVAEEMKDLTQGKVEVSFSSGRYLEFNRLGVCKGEAIQWLSHYLKIPMARTMAIGDNENDLSMIKAAGIGVAVASALDVVKAEADEITTIDFSDGAVAEMLEKHVLSK